MAKAGEVIITSNDKKEVAKVLMESPIYSRLLDTSESKMMLFHKRGFTSQVPEKVFREILDKIMMKTVSDEEFAKNNVSRLQEGVAVITPGEVPKLLVDDKKSIMSHLYGTMTYILREYEIK